jgi:hypothetical protein
MNSESRLLDTRHGGCYVNMDVIICIRPAVHAFSLSYLQVYVSNTNSRKEAQLIPWLSMVNHTRRGNLMLMTLFNLLTIITIPVIIIIILIYLFNLFYETLSEI